MKNILTAIVILGVFGIDCFTLMNNQKENEAKTAIVAKKCECLRKNRDR
jgi:hypothetical protein